MKVKTSDFDRFSPQQVCWDDLISPNSTVRIIDRLVEEFPLSELGFIKEKSGKSGAPPYDPKAMLKLFIYGYMNNVHSGRKLSKACEVNIEVMWLVNGIKPKYRTIQYFFSNNIAGLKKLFKWFGKLLYTNGIIKGEHLTIDSTKIKASNSKTNSKTIKGLSSQIKKLDKSIETYIEELTEGLKGENIEYDSEQTSLDNLEDLLDQSPINTEKKTSLKQVAQKVKERSEKQAYCKSLKSKMEEEGLTHLGLTDPDCDKVRFGNRNYGAGYNIQMVSDEQYKMLMYVDELGPNDFKALAVSSNNIVEQYQLKNPFNFLGDPGYYAAMQISLCHLLAQTYILKKKEKINEDLFNKEDFIFDPKNNAYYCPNGNYLTTNGKEIEKKKQGVVVSKVYEYNNYTACKNCPLSSKCHKNKKGKYLHRSIYQDKADLNNERVKANPEIYKQRKALIEHQFGTIKHHWGFANTNYRGREKVLAQFNLIALSYNIRRLISIWDELKEKGLINESICYLLKFFAITGSIISLTRKFKKMIMGYKVMNLGTQ